MRSKKRISIGLARAVLRGVFFAGVVLTIPYLVFWAVNALGFATIDYSLTSVIALWVLAILVSLMVPPRKIYVAHI